MILGSFCVLIAACWSNFLVEFATIKFASVARFFLVRIEVLLDRSSSTSLGHCVFDGIILLLVLRVGASVLLRVNGLNSRGIMRILCEIREKSSDHLQLREDVGMLMLRSPPKPKPCLGGYDRCGSGRDRDRDRDQEDDGQGGDDGECYPEDEEFDVLILRSLVKKERRRAYIACSELDKERTATASAIDETMAMITRLQGEKNAVEVRANQERRMAEQRQAYDQEVIESLRWMLARCEGRRDVFEGRLQRWGRKLKMSEDNNDEDDDEDDQVDALLASEDEETDHCEALIISSLEFDSLQRAVLVNNHDHTSGTVENN